MKKKIEKSFNALSYDNQEMIKNKDITVIFVYHCKGNDLTSLVASEQMSEKAIAEFAVNMIDYCHVAINLVDIQ